MDAPTNEGTWHGLEELREGLRASLRRHTRDENEIDDVVQETFVRAARYRARREEPERLSAWVARIARNVLADGRRRRRRWMGDEQGSVALDEVEARGVGGEAAAGAMRLGSVVVDRDTALRQLGEALVLLAGEDRRVLGSYYGGAGSCRRTADECGIPPHLVKVRLFRARRRLRRSIHRRLALWGDERGLERAS